MHKPASLILRHRAELRLSVRITVAALLSYAMGEALGLVQSLWAVLTAVIVMQGNVGGSLKATAERLLGTLGGSLWGLAVIFALPHKSALVTGLALVIAVFPLAVVVAFRPTLRVAPITAIILLLGALGSAHGPVQAATDRSLEILLGCAVAFFVSLTVLPARAHGELTVLGGKALGLLADELKLLTDMLQGRGQGEGLQALHDRLRLMLARLEVVTEEVERERASHLSDGPDPRPVARTLRRLRSDLIILARSAVLPLPDATRVTLSGPLDELSRVLTGLMQELSAALAQSTAPPAAEAALVMIDRYAEAIAALRKDGALRSLTDEAIARLFSSAFAFDQLRRDMMDLAARAEEFYRWKMPVRLKDKKAVS